MPVPTNDVFVDFCADGLNEVVNDPVMNCGYCHVVDVCADCEQFHIFVRDQVDIADNVTGLCDGAADCLTCSRRLCGCLRGIYISGELGNVNLAEQGSAGFRSACPIPALTVM